MNDEYEIRRAAYDAVANGDAEIVGVDDSGNPLFAMTEEGRERAMKVIDSAIKGFGDEAAEVLAEALGVSVEVGELLVSMRK